MLHTYYLFALPLALLTASISAQCVTPGYIPCLPAGSNLGSIDPSNFGNSGLWDTLQSVASDPIQKAKRSPVLTDARERSALKDRLAARQNALCCAPDPDKYCLLLTDGNIPFCYDSTTTRYVFSDESYGFIDNGTYYAADGTFVDFKDGTYSMTDGETGTFAPATSDAGSASQAPTATVPGTGQVTNLGSNGGSSGKTTPSATSGSSGGSGPSSSGSGSSSQSQSQPKKNESVDLKTVGAWTLSALAAGFITFAVL